MPTVITCPRCRATYPASARVAGRFVACRACGNLVRVPHPPAEPAADPPIALLPVPDDRRPPRHHALLIAGLVVFSGMAAGVALVFLLATNGPAPTAPAVAQAPHPAPPPVDRRPAPAPTAAPTPPASKPPDPIRRELDRARSAHAAELERLRRALLDDIDGVIRATEQAGQPTSFLVKERAGFADAGVTPLLPPLQPATRAYRTGVRAADAALDAAYEQAARALERAGRRKDADAVRQEWDSWQAGRL